MNQNDKLKQIVRDKYSEIARQTETGCGCCGTESGVYNIMTEKYDGKNGYAPEADLGLGCGIPTDYIDIKEGDTVLDLGSGAGNDAFIASRYTGNSGLVIGVDMTEDMIHRANQNKTKLNIPNVDFRLGEIENLPVDDNSVDVVISNCVLNLVPDKSKAFSEIYRVMKTGASFSVSDIVLEGLLPEAVKKAAELYAGCVSGSVPYSEYIGLIENNGFSDITVHKKREINIPDSILEKVLSPEDISEFKNSNTGIYSITVSAKK